jgi:hypothetical protein
MIPELRQQLLELQYGLLPEGEEAALHRRIETEPEVAAAYAEIQKTASLFAEAARLNAPRPAYKREEQKSMSTDAKTSAKMKTTPVRPSFRRGANWFVGVATVLLIVVAVAGYLYQRREMAAIASAHLRLVVSGPSTLESGVDSSFSLATTEITGKPIAAEVEMNLLSSDGKQIVVKNQRTDAEGRIQFTIPRDLSLPSDTTIKFVAWNPSNQEKEEFSAPLAVKPARFCTQLSLDKPLYQPGETVFYRSLTLTRFGMTVERELPLQFEILDPSGAAVADSQLSGVTDRGVGNGSFAIPDELAGGEYTLVVKSPNGAIPEEKRKFFIRRYSLPRLKKELEFARDSYTPGDTVIADFSAHRAEGGPASGAKLRIVATVDQQAVFEKDVAVNDAGAYRIEFKLPEKIERGDGQLAAILDDGGTRETMAKTIPINLGKVEVKFYPESGDLVEGIENRVYFTAKNPVGKPVHLHAQVVNPKGMVVADVETTYEGMGVFRLMPSPNTSYRLKIKSPVGVKEEPELPAATSDRFLVMNTGSGVFDANAPIEFNIRSAKPNVPLVVGAWCRGVLVAQKPIITQDTPTGMNPVSMELPEDVGGVIRLTVFDYTPPNIPPTGSTAASLTGNVENTADPSKSAVQQNPPTPQPPKPIAERLVYRRLANKLTVRATNVGQISNPSKVGQISNLSEKEPGAATKNNDRLEICPTLTYSPGEKVKMSLEVVNEKGDPIPAALGVAVVDDALLSLADDKSPNLTTHFLLTTEIDKPENLEKADFFLSNDVKNQIKPATALDLLLGTQGWRRFVEKTLPELREEGAIKDQLTRIVAMNGTAGPPTLFDNLGKIQKSYETSLECYRAEQTRIVNAALVVCFFAALGLLVLVVMLGLFKLVRGFGFWLPALGVTTCGVLIALMALSPSLLNLRKYQVVAFASYREKSDIEKRNKIFAELRKLALKHGASEYPVLLDEQNVSHKEKVLDDKLALDRATKLKQMMEQDGKIVAPKPAAPPVAPAPLEVAKKALPEEIKKLDAPVIQRIELRGLEKKEAFFGGNVFVDLNARAMQEEIAQLPRFTVRQYAHEHIAAQPGVRSDFAETLYWNPLLIADADGRANVDFALSDSVTTFRLRADAHGAGRIGSGRADIVSRIPFNLEPKLPLEVTAGDRIDLPVAVANDSPTDLDVGVKIETGDLVKLDGDAQRQLKLASGRRGREYFRLDVTGQKGDCPITVRGTAGNLADSVEKKLRVVPPGFPKNASYSGRIDGPQEVVVRLPESWVPGSLEVTLNAFPTSLASLQKGLDGILQEPNGCFEQTSTSNYPNVMTMQYMEDNNLADPAVTRRAKELMQKGYAKLTGFECKQKGYEWFGGDPGHEALTAYGLMQFRDMKQVYPVDDAMIKRTAEWLIARRDGKGGFERNARALDSFGGAPAEVTDAYITWALCESGEKNLEKEVAHSISLAEKTEDAYVVALAASAALDAGNQEQGRQLLDKLVKLQADDGHLSSKLGSITRSGGVSLEIETTALAALAWLKQEAFTAQANKAIEWIVKNRQGNGGFGSTQATILALKAMVGHAKANKHPVSAGKLILASQGATISEKEFSAERHETISLGGLEAQLKPGDNSVTISLTGENKMPYALEVGYRSLKPDSDEKCPVRLKTSLAKGEVRAGETVALMAEVSNSTDDGQPMTIAILGLPAGLESRPDQLEELKKAGTIDYYETRAREVIFYWRSLAPKKQIAMKLDLIAAIPGKYTAPASRAYLYYTPEQKQWTEPVTVEISK